MTDFRTNATHLNDGVQTGNDTGVKATRTIGDVGVMQRTTVAANNSAGAPATMLLPSGSDVVMYLVDVEVPFSPGALATAADFSISHGASLVTNVVVSASGRYDALSEGTKTDSSLLRNVTSTVEAFVSTQSLASAITLGQAMLTVIYVQN